MTLLVDNRAGSHELVKPLRKLGLPVEETRLESADVMFEGRGESGKPVLIGVEYKKLGELVQALRTERLQGHQLLKMQAAYDFNYLLIEGEVIIKDNLLSHWVRGRGGRKELKPIPGRMTRNEFEERLETFLWCAGLVSVIVPTQAETLRTILIKYRWWTDRALDEHTSHIAIYRPPALVPMSEFRVFMQSLSGISFKTSKAIEAHFYGSIKAAVNASREEWLEVPGIGTKLATAITKTFHG